MPPSEDGALPSPSQRRYQTRRPPTTLGASSSRPKKQPMVTQPPIEGNWIVRLGYSTLSYALIERLLDIIRISKIHSTYCRGDIYMLVSFEEGASAQHVYSGCAPTLQHISTSAYGAEERSYTGGLVQDIKDAFSERYSTLDKWTNMTAYVTHPGAPARPEHLEIPKRPAATTATTVLTPEATFSTPPTTPGTLPVVPANIHTHPSKSSITISISEFRGLCHTLQTLTATQSVLAQQMASRTCTLGSAYCHPDPTYCHP
ncbi:hypothetical protein CK203_117147 [Vitis vinifera]|uniref:Uncharacterized protein n=1 Tax=Vitis vinifera TaxID=29760 RepID=A0A438D3L0_VITVI|nr:hypothetical protein CK203_117147 [Vitis vinifera]